MKKINQKNVQARSKDYHDMAASLKDQADTTKLMYHRGMKGVK